jgi:predicted O-methyltransferase YrrM
MVARDRGVHLSVEAVFVDDSRFRIGDVDFHLSFQTGKDVASPDGFLSVMKTRVQIERYLRLCAELDPKIIVEVGIKRGGGTAFLHALNQPRLLVAIELTPEPAPALSAYIADRGLSSVVKPHYGVNQADRDGVAAIMAKELDGRLIDLVIDDASHLLDESRVTFETLFGLVRPGGIYVIEDWNAHHLVAETMIKVDADVNHPRHAQMHHALNQALISKPVSDDPRLVRLPLELVLARASRRDIIREVTVMDNWVLVRRGDEPIEPGSFRLADLAKDYFRNLRPLG